ncbi:hypothetical protein [Bradyrhizobium sp. URHC0002]
MTRAAHTATKSNVLEIGTVGFEALLRAMLSGYGYRFFLIGILAALRAFQHSLEAHDPSLSRRHQEVLSKWWKKMADDTKIPDSASSKRSQPDTKPAVARRLHVTQMQELGKALTTDLSGPIKNFDATMKMTTVKI